MGLWLRDGTWYVRQMIRGVRRVASTGYTEVQRPDETWTNKNRERAEKAAQRIVVGWWDEANGLTPAERPVEAAKAVPTFGSWATTYARLYSARKALKSQDTDAVAVRVFGGLPFRESGKTWAETPLDRFKKSDCEAAVLAVQSMRASNPNRRAPQPLSKGRVQRLRNVIQSIFERAVEDDLIVKNPWKGVERWQDQVRHRILREDQQDAFLSKLPPEWRRFVTVVLETGLRLEGAHGLDMRWVRELHDGKLYVHVSEKSQRHGTYCPVCRKADRKCREVPVSKAAYAALQEQVQAPAKDSGRRHGKVLTSPLWSDYSEAWVREVLKDASVRAKLTDEQGAPIHISPHDLRHTFGHRYLVRGGDITKLSRILGHASVAVTDRHYAYLRPTDLHDAMMAVMEGVRT